MRLDRLVVVALFLFAGCASPPPPPTAASPTSEPVSPLASPTTLPPNTRVIENAGTVCFQPCASCGVMDAFVEPRGCLSSSCDIPFEVSGTVTIDRQAKALRFTTRFVILDDSHRPGTPRTCTADCNGGGRVSFHADYLELGTWSVWLGGTRLGEVQIPFRGDTNTPFICLGVKL